MSNSNFQIASTVIFLLLATSGTSLGQIVEDGTLSTQVQTTNNLDFTVTSGSPAGNNLFHSFEEFSVPREGSVVFAIDSGANVANIITRVTGNNISNLDGLIQITGSNADLFLINPNGIVFGDNASLNLGGSFLATTATSIEFKGEDDTVFSFSAANPAGPPLLTISAPIGLQIEPNAGSIEVGGNGHNLFRNDPFSALFLRHGDVTGMSVLPGKTIALVGGPVSLTGGVLTAKSARIELGSVEFGLVGLERDESDERVWQLNYDQIQNFADIKLSKKALVDISGMAAGNIRVQGRQIEMRDSSLLLAIHEGSARGSKIEVNATDSLTLTGGDRSTPLLWTSIGNITLTGSQGTDIEISTGKLSLIDGGVIFSTAIDGVGGNVRVNARESVEVIGLAPFGINGFSSLTTFTDGSGNAGLLEITTNRLTVRDGGRVGSATNIGSSGNGGKVTINAESIQVIGINSNFLTPSAIFSSTVSNGNAGRLTIFTKRLMVDGGGRVDSSTFATGNAGSLTINASESVEIKGRVEGSINPTLVIAAANEIDPLLAQSFGLESLPLSGRSGSLNINTPLLKITDGAAAAVAHNGTGDAGTIKINAQEIVLADGGSITAVTDSGEGGNIRLAGGNLQLRNGSQIIATAGGAGNGGNLNLNLDTIVALDNSDIVANAFRGSGGNIQINTEGIFGTEFRDALTPESDITASSELGVAGIVTIAQPEVDPSSGLLPLSEQVRDSREKVVAGCAAREGSSFIATGRGGLPEDPTAPLRSLILWQDLQDFSRINSSGNLANANTSVEIDNGRLRQQATGWIINGVGNVELVGRTASHSPDLECNS